MSCSSVQGPFVMKRGQFVILSCQFTCWSRFWLLAFKTSYILYPSPIQSF